jgi:hypothetical protein
MVVFAGAKVAGGEGLSFVLAHPAVRSARQAAKRNRIIFIRLDYIRLWVAVCELKHSLTNLRCELG